MTINPKRIQRKRTKGWRMPDNAVYVGRPTKWGNPFKVVGSGYNWNVEKDGELTDPWPWARKLDAINECVELFSGTVGGILSQRDVEELRGKDLACWCSLDSPCHADVLLELANQE